MPSFSIALIARNEARNVPRLMRSLAPFTQRGGEVVLLDTGSTDDTRAVAAAEGCRVSAAGARFDARLNRTQARTINQRFAAPGEGPLVKSGVRLFHFGEARQAAAALAANDMVLFVDGADDVLALDVDWLDEQIRGGARRLKYWREYTFNNAPERVVPHHFSVFYDRRLYRWLGRTHETLYAAEAGGEASAPPTMCSRDRFFLRHISDRRKSRNFYLPGLALDVLEGSNNARATFYFGRELFYAGWPHSALQTLEAHAAREGAWAAERAESLCIAAQCYEKIGRPDAADDCYRRAAGLRAGRREPLLRLAERALDRGDFQASVNAACEALGVDGPGPYMELQENFTYRPHAILYWSYFWMGRSGEARRHWELCRDLAPANERFAADARLFPA